MIKCVHPKCKYPRCDFTCGLNSNDIIKMLQKRIDELLEVRETLRGKLWNLYEDAGRLGDYLSPDREFNNACAKACKFGYIGCIHNPEYLRRYYPEYWVEIGMPTECEECIDERCVYDDEDK